MQDFKELSYMLCSEYLIENILIVNTHTTGLFLDDMYFDKPVKRIKYTPDNFENFITEISNINEKYDLILVDPYHEYKESITTFRILVPLLSDKGVLISHDCYPPDFIMSSPTIVKGCWCGVTYAAFIEIAYNNSENYYGVIKDDYGLGIISKIQIQFVKKNLDYEKQKIFLDIFFENEYEKAYNYFIENSNEIIGTLNII